MQGSLALGGGTLFVGAQAKTVRVRAFDLGGRALGTGFTFRDAQAGRSAAAGMALDADRCLLVADTPADRVRRFSVFGVEVGGLGAPQGTDEAPVLPGLLRRPVDVAVQGNRQEGLVVIACAGVQRHAVQRFDPEFGYVGTCASLGDPARAFDGVSRIALDADRLYVAESTPRLVQVFRGGEFLFAFRLTDRSGEALEPSALAPVGDGRLVVACRAPRSGLFLVDSSGRPLSELAVEGDEDGAVLEPCDAVLAAASDDRHARLFVLDRDGLRLQVFTLEGRCHGTIPLEDSLWGAGDPREKKGGR